MIRQSAPKPARRPRQTALVIAGALALTAALTGLHGSAEAAGTRAGTSIRVTEEQQAPTWAEEFSVLDTATWERRTFRDANSLDGANFPENVSVTPDGHLRLRAAPLAQPTVFWGQPITHGGGYVRTLPTRSIGYGRVDIRAKLLPTRSSTGLWAGLWFRDRERRGEIDLAEIIGTPNRQPGFYPADGTGIQQTTYANTGVKTSPHAQRNFRMPSSADRWHVYTLDWSRTHIAMRIDGEETFRTTDPRILAGFSGSLDVRVSQFIGENWGARVGPTTGKTVDTTVDYIRYWKAA